MDARSRHLRVLALKALEGGKRGHVGSTMSLIEILRVLYDVVLVYDPSDPGLSQRDRLILSKGHGCIALYAVLADKGFFSLEELSTFCSFHSRLGGHPEYGHVPGVEASTGALGHGLAIGVGLAMAARMRGAGNSVVVVMGDGELNEGSVWESALAAAHHGLSHLTVIVDRNGQQAYGNVSEVWDTDDIAAKWRAFGFDAVDVDGHDIGALRTALLEPRQSSRPRALVAHTVKGFGIDFAEMQPQWHHKSSLDSTDIEALKAAIARA